VQEKSQKPRVMTRSSDVGRLNRRPRLAVANDNRPSAGFIGRRAVTWMGRLAVLLPLILLAGAIVASFLR
jgi:hypothetical protein